MHVQALKRRYEWSSLRLATHRLWPRGNTHGAWWWQLPQDASLLFLLGGHTAASPWSSSPPFRRHDPRNSWIDRRRGMPTAHTPATTSVKDAQHQSLHQEIRSWFLNRYLCPSNFAIIINKKFYWQVTFTKSKVPQNNHNCSCNKTTSYV